MTDHEKVSRENEAKIITVIIVCIVLRAHERFSKKCDCSILDFPKNQNANKLCSTAKPLIVSLLLGYFVNQ